MKVSKLESSDILLITPSVFADPRGTFSELWRKDIYADIGVNAEFVQDNVSVSVRNTLRGLHFQDPSPQGKLVSALSGKVFDVAVDLRKDSENFGKWFGLFLDDVSRMQLYIPPGYAHGFQVVSDVAQFHYKCTSPHQPMCEHVLLWNDPTIKIDWPIANPRLSEKDAKGKLLFELFPPPDRP